MPYNGSGSFSPPGANYPAVSGTTATAANRNAVDADFASGLSNAITKDGQTTVTANIPLGANKITGLAAGTAATDATNVANLQNGTGTYVATVGGTADVITLTASPAITAYAAGQRFSFIASGANTTNVTVNISALGAKAVTKKGATALVAGDISSGGMVVIEYDGTQFQAVGLTSILDEDDMASDSATLPPSQQSVKAYVPQTIVKRKAADESVSSSTTLQDDDDLFFAIAANQEWVAQFDVSWGDALSAANSVKIAINAPSGATIRVEVINVQQSQTTVEYFFTTIINDQIDPVQENTSGHTTIHVWVLNGATPGNIQFRWAQSSSSTTPTIAKKGSKLIAHQLA